MKNYLVYFEEVEGEKEVIKERMKTKLMTKELQKRKEREENVGTFWLKIENSESIEDVAVYLVDIPTKDQNTPKVMLPKLQEVENLIRYEMFKEVEDCGQKRIGSRGMVTQKGKADGQIAQRRTTSG